MGFVSSKEYNIGDVVKTTKVHKALCGKFTKGSIVTIIGEDPIRGYEIQDEFGNRISEIGWVV